MQPLDAMLALLTDLSNYLDSGAVADLGGKGSANAPPFGG